MTRTLAALALLAVSCSSAPPPRPAARPHTTRALPPEDRLTTTSEAATTTTTAARPRRAVRPTTTVVAAEGNEGAAAQTRDDAFWRRLADCECASGRCGGPHVSYFQLSPDTARKVGIDGSESYEEQRAAAQEWARRIHPREGTSAGWPTCWGRAAA